jgi:hypothetical protein
MSSPIEETIIFVMSVGAQSFREKSFGCEVGPNWPITFPSGKFPRAPVVVVTPNNQGMPDPTTHNAAAVGMVEGISNKGFTLDARNTDCAAGFAGFNVMAVLEIGGPKQVVPSLHIGVTPPQHFQPDCIVGDTITSQQAFLSPMSQPTVLLTASNLNIKPFETGYSPQGDNLVAYHNSPVVGIVQEPTHRDFTLRARNSDCSSGDGAFYYAAVDAIPKPQGYGDLWIDTGLISPMSFSASCTLGDTQSQSVVFHRPFLTPPIVLLTATDTGLQVNDPRAFSVGIAQDVTPYGFTLTARNSSCYPGKTNFFWIAIGCGPGCDAPLIP